MNAFVQFRLCKLSTLELLEKIDKQIDQLYQDNKIPLRHIPARPDEDFDLLVGECLVRFKETLQKLEDINTSININNINNNEQNQTSEKGA